jgi:hypothetical protein
MAKQIEVASRLAPSEVLDRLARYGKEWRESKIPLSVRGRFFSCRLSVRGQEFELEFEPQGKGGAFIWRGQVISDGVTGGSRIHARARLKRWYAITSVIVLGLFIGWWVAPQLFGTERSADRAVIAIEGTCVMLIMVLAVHAGRAAEQGYACEAIFAQILSTAGDPRTVAT